jgi:hypothetical protein
MIRGERLRRQPKEAFMSLKVEEIIDGGVFVRFSTEKGNEFWAGTPPPDPPLERLEDMKDSGIRGSVWIRFDSYVTRVVNEKGNSMTSIFNRLEGGIISSYRFRGMIRKTYGKGQIPKDGRWVHTVVLNAPNFEIYSDLVSEEELTLEAGTMVEADGEILAAVVEREDSRQGDGCWAGQVPGARGDGEAKRVRGGRPASEEDAHRKESQAAVVGRRLRFPGSSASVADGP